MNRDRRRALFEEYGSYHRSRTNRLTHALGFPLIFLALFPILDRVGIPHLGAVTFAVFTALNFTIEWRLALVTTIGTAALYAFGSTIDTELLGGTLGIGVGIPVIGHVVFERRWPDTMVRFGRFELVGHLWFLNRLLGFVSEVKGSGNKPAPR